MIRYLPKCPHMKSVKREIGDFVKEGNKSYFHVERTITEILPCECQRYQVKDEHPFLADSGIDPEGKEVTCKGCGKTYYLFGCKGKATANV